jgi:AcrR family transcriptional regulator
VETTQAGADGPATETRERLVTGARLVLFEDGLSAASARAIAARAGVNQALIFYHFGSVYALLSEACLRGTEERVALYRDRFAAVTSLTDLLAVGAELRAAERAQGNVTVLAQMLAGAQTDARLAPIVAEALHLWIVELEAALTRVLAAVPFADLLDVPGLARLGAGAFIGIELYEGVDAEGATTALDTLRHLVAFVDVATG